MDALLNNVRDIIDATIDFEGQKLFSRASIAGRDEYLCKRCHVGRDWEGESLHICCPGGDGRIGTSEPPRWLIAG